MICKFKSRSRQKEQRGDNETAGRVGEAARTDETRDCGVSRETEARERNEEH